MGGSKSVLHILFYILQRLRMMSDAKAKSKSEKFPPPHQDGEVGHRQNGPLSFNSSIFNPKSSRSLRNDASKSTASRRKNNHEEPLYKAPSRRLINAFNPSSIGWSMDFRFNRRWLRCCGDWRRYRSRCCKQILKFSNFSNQVYLSILLIIGGCV